MRKTPSGLFLPEKDTFFPLPTGKMVESNTGEIPEVKNVKITAGVDLGIMFEEVIAGLLQVTSLRDPRVLFATAIQMVWAFVSKAHEIQGEKIDALEARLSALEVENRAHQEKLGREPNDKDITIPYG